VREDDLAQGSLYPPLSSIRDVSAHIAARVAEVAYRSKLARGGPPADLLATVRSQMYQPRYDDYASA
jgi:malate dehydrogenase (oxaloacetate-decarboxylating)(NADP+)